MRPTMIRSRNDLEIFLADNDGVDVNQLVPLPFPYEDWHDEPIPRLTAEQASRIEPGPDGVCGAQIPVPSSDTERERLVAAFLNGLKKLLTRENNWSFLQPLLLSMENCVKCQTCAEACPIFTGSGRMEIYRPTFRAEMLRKIVDRYIKPGGALFPRLRGNDIELTWDTVVKLAVLFCRGPRIERDDLPPTISHTSAAAPSQGAQVPVEPLQQAVQRAEVQVIQSALAATKGRRADAAALLGISRKTLWEKIKNYGLDGGVR